MREERGGLEYETDAPGFGRNALPILAEETDLRLVRPLETGQRPEKRGLSSARGTGDNGHAFRRDPGLHLKGEAGATVEADAEIERVSQAAPLPAD